MTRIAFATYRAAPLITDVDELVVGALAERGVAVDGVPWDGPVEWDRYAAVLPRSTWDFHHRLPEFRLWLDALASVGVPTLNPSRLLQWNLSKHYLQSLATLGVGIVPTLWVTSEPGGARSLGRTVAEQGWGGAVVVKPTVSASAYGTWVAQRSDPAGDELRYRAALEASAHGLMLQPFLPEVRTQGEWSLVFIGGQFSHAVLKRPAEGDFRVQREYGGSAVAAEPDVQIVDAAARAVAAAAACAQLGATDVLYARVDGVVHDGRFLLMELEAVEPVLFFGLGPEAPARMATQIVTALARLHPTA